MASCLAQILIIICLIGGGSAWFTMKTFSANNQVQQLEVNRGGYIHFSCHAEGVPLPIVQITRYKTGETLPSSARNGYFFLSLTGYTTVTATIRATCSDTGLFSCKHVGTMSKVEVEKFISVFVRCPPQLISSEETTQKFDISTGTDLKFDIKISCYPEPTVFELHQKHLVPYYLYDVSYNSNSSEPAKGQVTLTMTHMLDDQSGKYRLAIHNGISPVLWYSFHVIVDSTYKKLVECNSIQVSNAGTASDPSMQVEWTCSISDVDRLPDCHFGYKQVSGEDEKEVQTAYVDVKPHHTLTTGHPVRYEKECTMRVPVLTLTPSHYQFKAVMFPARDHHSLGSNMTSDINLSVTAQTCTHSVAPVDEQTVTVTCQSMGFYPQITCRFQHRLKNKGDYKDSSGTVTTSPPHCTVEPPVCFYHCTLTATPGDLGGGDGSAFDFRASMVPLLRNGTRTPSDSFSDSSPINNQPTIPERSVKKDEGLSDGNFAGIIVACGLVMLLLGLVIGFLVMTRRKRRQANEPDRLGIVNPSYHNTGPAPPRPPRSPYHNGADPQGGYVEPKETGADYTPYTPDVDTSTLPDITTIARGGGAAAFQK